ncbi:putative protein kinase ISR1 Ecym_2618 [Eremothecium cymbalariae DBVPG|uniref:Protein kinase domain-containing protein n=1 Tax=Eremothecium cymbalariae (strain CBS 270.75 / DBVPG 7215 / KCTC 17166 / NRRL Y-17582) TaxID=931890 RepID=G8JQJ8_ERECY|nr:Hypothetical protein Ecym_2618 [Eremothecium cymbalariae DBVPG\
MGVLNLWNTPPSSPLEQSRMKQRVVGGEVGLQTEGRWRDGGAKEGLMVFPSPTTPVKCFLGSGGSEVNRVAPSEVVVGDRDDGEGRAAVEEEFVRILQRQNAGLVAVVLGEYGQDMVGYVAGLLRSDVGMMPWQLGLSAIGKGSSSVVFKVSTGVVVKAEEGAAARRSEETRSLALKVPLSKRKAGILFHEVLIYSYLWQQARGRLCANHVVSFHGVTAITKEQYARLRANEVVPGLVLDRMDLTLEKFYQEQPIAKRQWWKFASDLLVSLQFLRQSLVIHGDIKTANVLVRGRDAFLADFTSASVRDCPSGEVLNTTLEYCSPLLIEGMKPNYDSDLYATGLCLLCLITKHEPYRELSMLKSHTNIPVANSLHETQWLINAISKCDPLKYNVLKQDLYDLWEDELRFLKRFFQSDREPLLHIWIAESRSQLEKCAS